MVRERERERVRAGEERAKANDDDDDDDGDDDGGSSSRCEKLVLFPSFCVGGLVFLCVFLARSEREQCRDLEMQRPAAAARSGAGNSREEE